jgi:protein-disulfide isomerase
VVKKLIIALFVLSVLFLGFTVGRYTNFVPMTKASWAAKTNQEFNKLDETQTALALAIAASSPTLAQEMIKHLEGGNVSADAIQNLQKLAVKAMGNAQGGQRAQQGRPSFDEEMANVQDVKPAADAFARGTEGAPIQIVMFTELLCPYCGQLDPIIEQVMKKYEGKARLVFQTYLIHGEKAEFWHRAAYAAGKQGKFWDVVTYLFSTQQEWARNPIDDVDAALKPLAQKFKLNLSRLKKDMESDEIKQQIKNEVALGQKLGVHGTPAVFINGRFFKGRRDADFYSKVIDTLLAGR